MSKGILLSALIFTSFIASSQITENVLANKVRVKFQKSFSMESAQFDTRSPNGYLVLGDIKIDEINNQFKALALQRVFPFAGKFEEKHERYGLHLWYDITVEANMKVEDLVKRYGELDIINKAEAIQIYDQGDAELVEVSTNDPRLIEQWHYDNNGQTGGTPDADISLFEAWEVESGDQRVVVSVHDSGIDPNHPDLVNRLWVNAGEIPNDGIDNDNNGFVDDYNGYNFAAAVVGGDPSSVYDYNGHGTHTSGTIAGENNNGIGVSGVAGGSKQSDGVRIMMMRLGDDYGSNSIFNPAPSFVYAADMGAVISSNSWGGGGYDQSLVDAINYFVAEGGSSSAALDGGLVIMSSGNSSSSFPDYRSDLDGVMMVSATNHNDQRAWYSNYGQWVDISAPGGETSITSQGVLSTLPNYSYGFFQGTSMACPHVSGGAALLASKAYGSGLTSQELFDAIVQGVNSIDAANPSYVGLLGSGRLNVAQSLELVGFGSGGSGGELVIDPTRIVTEIQEGDSETYTIRLSNTSNFDIEIDIESENQDWLEVEVINLSMAANSTAKFDITLNATSGGDLTDGELIFSFISLDNLEKRSLPISVYTLGDPFISVQDSLMFGINYLTISESAQLTITNSGTDYLELVHAFHSNSDFNIDFDSVTLAPNQQTSFEVVFTPSIGGEIIDSLYFVSNDPLNDSIKVILLGTGNANNPPTLSLDQSEIQVEIENSDRYGSEQLTITNTGDEELSLSIQVNPYRALDLSEFGFEVRGQVEDDTKEIESENSLENLGGLFHAIQSPVERERGLAWVDNHLWIRDANSDQIYKYDVEIEAVVDSITSIAENGVALAFDGEYLWEHDYRTRLIKYSLQGDSISQTSLDQSRDYGNGITVDREGIWMSYGGSFVLLDMLDGADIESFSNSYTYGLEGLLSIGSRIFTISNGTIHEIVKEQNYYNNRTRYIAGYYREETGDIAFDGMQGWVAFNNYGVLLKIDLFQNFLNNPYPSNFVLQAGELVQTTIEYNLPSYSFDAGLAYSDEVQITSNDPENGVQIIPFQVDIEGSPQISTDPGSLFIDAYIGHVSTDTLIISNEGNELLSISSITSSDPNFEFEFSPIDLIPNGELLLPITIELSVIDTLAAVLTVSSNDPATPELMVDMEAISFYPPNIGVAEDSLFLSLYESQIDSLKLTISNSGDGDLLYYIENEVNVPVGTESSVLSKSVIYESQNVIKAKQNDLGGSSGNLYSSSQSGRNSLAQVSPSRPLQDVLSSLNENHSLITSLIPNRFNFYDGEYGSGINDGGNDMYDGGNYLSTNLGGNFSYTNGIIDQTSYTGGESYFTAKYEGLFVFASDLDNVNSFQINGNLGADGSGSVDGAVLSVQKGGREFLGFVKRVYNAYDPSVNHLIIVQNVGSPTHQFDTYSNSDFHSVEALSSVNRIYHLLFASSYGGYIDDDAILEIMEAFLDISGESGQVNTLEAGETIEDYVVFDTENLNAGVYEYNVRVRSNDPLNPSIQIPTSLTVDSTALFSVSYDTIDFEETHVGTIGRRQVHMSNAGSDTLYIGGYEIDGADYFGYESYGDTIPPSQSLYLTLEFSPIAEGEYNGSFTVFSNDRINPEITIPLEGLGIPSSVFELTTSQVIDTVSIGTTKSYPFSVKNVGTDPLDYRIVISERTPINLLIEEIELINQDAKRSNRYDNTDADSVAGYLMSGGQNRVMVLSSGNYFALEFILNQLESTNEFEFISFVDVSNFGGVSLHVFEQYDAVLLWKENGYSYYDPTLLGNTLADYVDIGGGVVTSMYENVDSSLGGRWSDDHEKYSLLKSKNLGYEYGFGFSSMEKVQSDHPLLVNVDSLNGGDYSLRPRTTLDDVTEAAEVIATWSNGAPLIIAGDLGNAKRVDLGFIPYSDDYDYASWSAETDGIQILANALNYVANYTDGRTEVDWLTVDNYEVQGLVAGDSVTGNFIADTENLEEGWSAARATFYSNDSRIGFSSSVWLDILADGTSELSVTDTVKFKDLSIGFTGTQQLTITNGGNGGTEVVLEIDTLSSFKLLQPDTIKIGPYGRKTVNFLYEASAVGSDSEFVTIRDLSDAFEKNVLLSVEVTEPGVIRLAPSEVELTVEYQGQAESEFTIHNDGEGSLEFAFEAFHLPKQLSSTSQNNTDEILFARNPEKREVDFRTGHAIIEGSGSDSFGYLYVDSNHEDGPLYSWNDISQTGVEIVLADDDASHVELPFEFPFYGSRHSELWIGSNGIIGTVLSGITSPINQQIPFSSFPNGFIAPFWKDLISGQEGQVFYQVSEDNIVIQYQEFEDYEQTGKFTFQISLYRSGDVLFQYEEMAGITTDATIGLENQQGTQGLQIAFNTQYLLSNLAVYISNPVAQINPEITSGLVGPGDSLAIPFTYSALDDLGGWHARELSILSNDTSSMISFVDILAHVEGVSRIVPSTDTLYFDSTYVDIVSKQGIWFENDSVGVLTISALESSNEAFEMLLPFYETANDIELDQVSYNMSLNTNTGRVEGKLSITSGTLIAIRAFTFDEAEKRTVWEIDATALEDSAGVYTIYDLVNISNQNLWALAKEEIVIDVFTSAHLDGFGGTTLLPGVHEVSPFEYSSMFPVLYKPNNNSADTAAFSIQSTAINSDEILIAGFGVGLKSDVSISVSTSTLDEVLHLGDSTMQTFTITNDGTDSLSFTLRLSDYRFESNLNPIGFGFDTHQRDKKISTSSDADLLSLRAPTNRQSDAKENLKEMQENSLESWSGFYGFLARGGDYSISTAQISDPSFTTDLLDISDLNFIMATEFLQGSNSTIISLDYLGNLYLIDLFDQNVSYVSSFQGDDSWWTGMTTDVGSGKLYACTRASLYELDLQTRTVVHVGVFDHYGMIGIAMNRQGKMYGYNLYDDFFEIDPNSGQSDYIGYIGFNAEFGQDLAYNSASDEFYMAAFNAGNSKAELRSVNVETGNASLIGTIGSNIGDPQMGSIAFPIVNSSFFFDVNPQDSIIAPGQSVEVIASFNSSDLSNGNHYLNLQVQSNDLSNPSIRIPVTLEVTGNNPKVGDYTKDINFGLLTVMNSSSSIINVQNLGEEVLVITLENAEEGFELGMNVGDSLRIGIDQAVDIPINFIPNAARTFEHDLLWSTNDPELPKIIVSLSGAGERASQELVLDLSSSHFDLPRNAEATAMLRLYSVGRDSISYTVRLEEDLDWLNGSADSSFIASGDSIEYSVSINTASKDIGEYSASIVLTSNDPLYDSLNLPITLSVYNNVPEVIVPLEAPILAVGLNGDVVEYQMSAHFQDADNDSIYYVISSRNSKVNFSLVDDVLSMFGVESGSDTLDIIVHDTRDTVITVLPIVTNLQPSASQSLPDFYTRVGESYVEFIDLDDYFVEPDNQGISYEVSALSEQFADININSENVLLIKGLLVLSEEVTITATDGYHSVDQQFVLTVDDVLASEEIGSHVSLFPNPVSSILTYEYNINLSEDVTIQLVDIAGKVLYSQKAEIISGKISGTLNVSEFTTGVYVMKVLSGDKTIFANRVSKQ